MTINSYNFPDVYKELGIDTSALGCIMLTTPTIDVTSYVLGGADDLYTSPDPKKDHVDGAVAQTKAHVTLLNGLLKPGTVWEDEVNAVLEGWNVPSVLITGISFFPSTSPDENYDCIIAQIAVTPELLEGHQRLQLLPHIDTFPDYTPHLTLAYIKGPEDGVELGETTRQKWLRSLELLEGVELPVTGLNYGDL